MTKRIKLNKTLLSRFWGNVEIQPNGCWRWTGSVKDSGYGNKWDGERVIVAHRWAYLHFVGPIPDGMKLDHLCHTADLTCMGGPACQHRRCVNPAHLEPVTNLENAQRGRAGIINGGRERSKTHCPQGHPYDESNTYQRLDKPGRECRTCTLDRQAAAKRISSSPS